MQAYTLYGLDEDGQPVSTEILKADDVNDGIRRLTHERARSFAAAELWHGPVLLMRVERPQSLQ